MVEKLSYWDSVLQINNSREEVIRVELTPHECNMRGSERESPQYSQRGDLKLGEGGYVSSAGKRL